MKDKLHVLFTMDVEPTTAVAGRSGPASNEAGLRAVVNYEQVLDAHGYRATYFVHPEVAEAAPGFFRELKGRGSSVGLHVHTTKFAPDPQPCELGGLAASDQRRILQQASKMFEAALGFRPTLFRPGCFSANDAAFGVLVELGFKGGGVSIPGRIWPGRHCIWAGADPYPHLAHASFRQAKGDLPFVEIPLSVDLTDPICSNPNGFYHYRDLRPGGMYSEEDEAPYDRRAALHRVLQRMAADHPAVKTLVVDVHNDRDFVTAGATAARHLREVLDGIGPECDALGWEAVPDTYDGVADRMLAARST